MMQRAGKTQALQAVFRALAFIVNVKLSSNSAREKHMVLVKVRILLESIVNNLWKAENGSRRTSVPLPSL